MRRSSGEAQTEPLAAIAALFAVGVGMTVFAGALPRPAEPSQVDPERVLQEVREGATTAGVLHPAALGRPGAVPAGWRINVTLETPLGRRTIGPTPAPDAPSATRPVTVALPSGDRRPGRLSVAVWR